MQELQAEQKERFLIFTERRERNLRRAVENEPLFEKYKIFDIIADDSTAGKNALVDMLHNYSERNNESYVISIARLRQEFQKIDDAETSEEQDKLKEMLGTILSAGLLPSESFVAAEEAEEADARWLEYEDHGCQRRHQLPQSPQCNRISLCPNF